MLYILSVVVTTENMNELIIIQNEFLDATSHSIYSAFSNTKTLTLLGSTIDDDKGNILLFIVLIGISCILAITSASLVYQAGYCACSKNNKERTNFRYTSNASKKQNTKVTKTWKIQKLANLGRVSS